ncbi:MAG: HlyD family secretion protein, partial [Deltaproteobacteria bacterium]
EGSMLRKLALPLLAAGLLIVAFAHAIYVQQPEPDPPPPVPPPVTPFGNTVAGTGMVEPSNEASTNSWIAVGSQLSGVVTNIPVHIGQTVEAGDLLFELDKRATEAELAARKAALLAAEEQLRKLNLQPRPEEVPPLEAQVEAAEAVLQQTKDQRDRDKKLFEKGGVSPEEMVRAEQAWLTARAQAALAKANLALLKAGAWEPDKAIADANVKVARAQLEQTETTLALQEIRAPVEGTILQINIRPGEFVSTMGTQTQPLILMGRLDPIHVRVNVDEEDIPRLKLNAPAKAKIRGDATQEEVPMTFVRLEPYVVPKMSLTGINVERVDTRVVQLIYAIDPRHKLVRDKKILVGQLVDVFIDTGP